MKQLRRRRNPKIKSHLATGVTCNYHQICAFFAHASSCIGPRLRACQAEASAKAGRRGGAVQKAGARPRAIQQLFPTTCPRSPKLSAALARGVPKHGLLGRCGSPTGRRGQAQIELMQSIDHTLNIETALNKNPSSLGKALPQEWLFGQLKHAPAQSL